MLRKYWKIFDVASSFSFCQILKISDLPFDIQIGEIKLSYLTPHELNIFISIAQIVKMVLR